MKWQASDYNSPFQAWRPPSLVYPCSDDEKLVLHGIKEVFDPLPPYAEMERQAIANDAPVSIEIPLTQGQIAFLENTAEKCISPQKKHSQEGMQGARHWVQRVDTPEGMFQRLTDGYGISLMFGERCHQFIRNSNNWRGISGCLLDLDVFRDDEHPDAPEPVYSLDALLDRYPLLARICTFILPSASSLYEGRPFKARGCVLFDTPITDQRVYRAFGDILCGELDCIPANVTKNPVAVGFGNTHNAPQSYRSESPDVAWIAAALQQATHDVIGKAKKRHREQKAKAALTEHYRRQRKGSHSDGENISAFIEQCDPVAEMVRDGYLLPGRGNEYRWHESQHDRSCDILDGVIHIFSHSMSAASPAAELEPVNAHRFYLYQLSGLDMTRDADKPRIREFLFERGYGSDPKQFAKQQQKAGLRKPIQLKKRPDVSFVAEALEKSREFLSNAFEKGKGLIGLRSDTGVGKTHEAIEVYQMRGIRGFISTPITELAKEIYGRLVTAEIDAFRWRGIQSEPDGVFPHEKPCIQPERYVAYLESGRNAYEILCKHCPEFERCLEDGYRGQEEKARTAQVTVAAHKDLLFNPLFRPTAKRLLPKDAGDMIVVDEFDVFGAFLEIDVTQARLETLAKTWHDHNLGTFAKLILQACLFEENPFESIRTLVKQLTDTERNQIFSALTQYRIGDTILSRQEAHALEVSSRPKTLSEINRLPLLETDDWNLLIQLELFFQRYTDPETAPLRWKDNTLTFAIQPLPLYTKAKVVCLSATLVKDFFLKTFSGRQDKRGDVSFEDGEDTEWHPNARVFQLRTNRNPRATLLIAELNEKGNWEYTGELTATGKAYMEQILESLKATDGQKAFISHKPIVDAYQSELDALGVKTRHFGGLVGLDAHFGRDTDDGITLHILGSPEIPQHEVEYRANLLSADKETVREVCVQSELTQAIGRAGLVKNPSTVVLWTSVELPSVSHREQTILYDDTDWTADIDGLGERIQKREKTEAEAEAAKANGDVEGLATATGLSERTARWQTEQQRQQSKADRDAEIVRRAEAGETQQHISDALGVRLATVNEVLVDPEKSDKDAELLKRIREMKAQVIGERKIAERLGISYGKVRNLLKNSQVH